MITECWISSIAKVTLVRRRLHHLVNTLGVLPLIMAVKSPDIYHHCSSRIIRNTVSFRNLDEDHRHDLFAEMSLR